MSQARPLLPQALSPASFAAFGQVISISAGGPPLSINDGTALRFDALALVQTDAAGRAGLSLFRAQPRSLPFRLQRLERHPLGSQAFMPLHPDTRYVVVVAAADRLPVAFLADGGCGVNLARGVWHHPLIALDRSADFLVVDRIGPGSNCEEVELAGGPWEIGSVN